MEALTCFLSTKMATASLLRCLESVATDGNHSTENLTFNTSWSLVGPSRPSWWLWAPVLECLPVHSTGRNRYQTTSRCTAWRGEGSGDPGLCWRNQGALHTLPLTRGRWGKISSQLTPKVFLSWSLCIINFSEINTGVIWVNLPRFFFFWFFVRCLTVLASVSLVPLVC